MHLEGVYCKIELLITPTVLNHRVLQKELLYSQIKAYFYTSTNI